MSGLFDQVVNYSPPLLTAGQVNYDGTWNAATNTPTLINPPDALSKGDYYVVSAAGTQFSISFAVGDWIISNGTAWEKVDLTDAVSSVFGRTGAVVGVSTDYSAVGLTNTAVGAANPSTGAFTSLSSSSTTTLNGTTVPANKTLVVTTDKLSALAATTSAELAGVISDETGSGSLVFANSPTLVTPALGTPSALVGTNITGTAAAFNINGTVGATTPSTVAATSVTALSNSGYQAVVGQLTSGDRVGISGQSSGSGTALVFFDNAQTTFRPAIFDASSHSLKISGVEKASVTSTGLQGAIGATTPSTGAFTSLSSTSGAFNGTVGATTPSTVAATTGTFTATGQVQYFSGATTASKYIRLENTGGNSYFGIEGATPAFGGTAYAAFLFAPSEIDMLVGSVKVGAFTATGLNSTPIGVTTASTGAFTTLSATGNAGVAGVAVPTSYNLATNTSGANTGGKIGTTSIVTSSSDYPYVGYNLRATSSSNTYNYDTADKSSAINFHDGGFRFFTAASGTAGNPITWTERANLTTTGLAVTGALSSTAGANFATSSGSVGIGTTSFAGSAKLQVAGGRSYFGSNSSLYAICAAYNDTRAQAGQGYYIGSTDSATPDLAFSNTDGTERVRITYAGNVGINETSPTQGKLVINNPNGSTDSGVTGNSLYLKAATANANLIRLSGAIATDLIIGRFGNADAFSIGTTGGATFATFNSTGLGIGTSSPSDTLQLARSGTGTYNSARFTNPNSTADFYVGVGGSAVSNGSLQNNAYLFNNGASAVIIGTNGTERARIDSSGNLLVGTTSALGGKLNVSTSNTSWAGWFQQTQGTGSSVSLIEYSAAAPNNSSDYFVLCRDNAAQRIQLRSNGGIGNYSANDVNLSDERLKKDIIAADSYLDKMCAIEVVKFKYKDQTHNDYNLGVIAQQVEAVAPEFVDVDGFDSSSTEEIPLKSIYQTDLSYGILKAVQELAEENKSLRKRLAALESN